MGHKNSRPWILSRSKKSSFLFLRKQKFLIANFYSVRCKKVLFNGCSIKNSWSRIFASPPIKKYFFDRKFLPLDGLGQNIELLLLIFTWLDSQQYLLQRVDIKNSRWRIFNAVLIKKYFFGVWSVKVNTVNSKIPFTYYVFEKIIDGNTIFLSEAHISYF